MIKVIAEKCPQDHKCPMISRCRAKSISQEGFKAPVVDDEKCVECLLCVENCPHKVFERVGGKA
jgi:TPP-dependent indolepyruvate ferredoxin oxidoreductase alpha subunit